MKFQKMACLIAEYTEDAEEVAGNISDVAGNISSADEENVSEILNQSEDMSRSTL